MEASEQQITALLSDIARMKSEWAAKLKPVTDAMVKAETAIQQLHEGFAELALVVQTLQATSYSGTFIWKINDVQRRRNEAKIEKVLSLYSAPFYTSRFGYKLCRGKYDALLSWPFKQKVTLIKISIFMVMEVAREPISPSSSPYMRGEYDALLTWPFRQSVTLMLLDQDKQRDIVQSFCPEPNSSSFQRPRNDMPQLPHDRLNSSYVHDGNGAMYMYFVHGNGATCIYFMGLGLYECTSWEWDHINVLLYHIVHRNITRILTKSSNPNRVPTISLSDFMMMWIREPMHLSTSSEGRGHGAH